MIASSPMLPTIRLLLQPTAGFGLDARLPMHRELKCYLSAEAYIMGGSQIKFGLEPTRFPFVRVQLAPSVNVSLRLPILPIAEFKRGIFGGGLTLYDQGSVPRLNMNNATMFWKGLRAFATPMVEVEHQVTVAGTILEKGQREKLKEAIKEMQERKTRQEGKKNNVKDRLQRPTLDPRKRLTGEEVMEELAKKMKEKRGERKKMDKEKIKRMEWNVERIPGFCFTLPNRRKSVRLEAFPSIRHSKARFFFPGPS